MSEAEAILRKLAVVLKQVQRSTHRQDRDPQANDTQLPRQTKDLKAPPRPAT